MTAWSDDLYVYGKLIDDPGGELTAQNAVEQFLELPYNDHSARKINSPVYWLLTKAVNADDKADWVMTTFDMTAERLDFYVFDGTEQLSRQSGGLAMRRDQSLKSLHIGSTFPFILPRGETRILALRVRSDRFVDILAHAQPAEKARSQQFDYQVILLLSAGVYLALFVYSLSISLATRDLSYLWLGLHTGCFIGVLLSMAGWWQVVFGFQDKHLYFYSAALLGAQLFGLLFFYRFFDLPGHYPRMRFCAAMVMLVVMLESVALMGFDVGDRLQMAWLSYLLVVIFSLLLVGFMTVKGQSQALLIAAGYSVFMFSVGSKSLAGLGYLADGFATDIQVCLASALTMMVYTVALSNRSRQLQYEKLAAELADDAKSVFLATMSHEIRSPLNGVLGMAQLLQKTPLSLEQRKWVQAIQDSGKSLLSILNNILTLSKFDAKKMSFEAVDFDLRQLLNEVVQILTPAADEKGVLLIVDVDERVPDYLRGDPIRYRQIIMNLGENAVKFTEQGEVVFKVSLLAISGSKYQLELSVRDTGIGMPKAFHGHLFDPFVQADRSISRRFGGAGLGLAIIKNLIDTMGGAIDFESTEGVGTCFWVRMEFELGKKSKQKLPLKPAKLSHPDEVKKLHILVVDDEEISLSVTVGLLAHAGYAPESVMSGKEALQLLRKQTFDLVFLDIHMPEMDGLEVVRRIRAARNMTPVIALTASILQEQQAEYLAAGMNAVIAKPVNQDSLRRVITEVVGNKFDATETHAKPRGLKQGQFLDQKMLQQHFDALGAQHMNSLLANFYDSGIGHVRSIETAWTNKDLAAVISQAHRLSGMASMLGLQALAESAESLEKLAIDDRNADLSAAINSLVKIHQQTMNIVQKKYLKASVRPQS